MVGGAGQPLGLATLVYLLHEGGELELRTSLQVRVRQQGGAPADGAEGGAPRAPPPLVSLPRIGVRLQLPPHLSHTTYFGRGPHENYADRVASAA
eukprot:1084060-Prymnesium_polylepis.1